MVPSIKYNTSYNNVPERERGAVSRRGSWCAYILCAAVARVKRKEKKNKNKINVR